MRAPAGDQDPMACPWKKNESQIVFRQQNKQYEKDVVDHRLLRTETAINKNRNGKHTNRNGNQEPIRYVPL